MFLTDKEIGDEGEAETGDETVNGVGGGCSETGGKARGAPFGQRSADA